MAKAGSSAAWTKYLCRMGACVLFSLFCHALLIFSPHSSSPVRNPGGDERITVILADEPSPVPAGERAGDALTPEPAETLPPPPRQPAATARSEPPLQKQVPAEDHAIPLDFYPPPPDKTEVTASTPESRQEKPLPASKPAAGLVPQPATVANSGKEGQEGMAVAGDSSVSDGPVTARFGTTDGPRIEKMTPPKYPPRAKRLRREGRVLLQLYIDRFGVVRTAEVVESAGFGFDKSALEALQSSRFSPATRSGRPVDCLALLPVQFVLEQPR